MNSDTSTESLKKENLKSEWQDHDDPVITKEVIEEFYDAILNSPELYPYFMELRPNGLWRKCNMMASYFTRVLNKDKITPADTEHLKKIHRSLNIKETSYDLFTGLFAHICCRNKSDARRKKFLSKFSLLKAHVCPIAGNDKIWDAFCGVISNLHSDSASRKEELEKKSGCASSDSFPVLAVALSRSEIWNEKAQYFHLRKRLRALKKQITVIYHRSKRMEMRIANLEMESRKQQKFTMQQRDLDLVYNQLCLQ